MKKPRRELPGIIRFLFGIISFALCICLLASSFITILVGDLGLLTSKVGLQQIIKDFLFSSAPANRPVLAPAAAGGSVKLDEFEMSGSVDMGGFDLGDIDLEAILSGDANVADILTEVIYEAMGEGAEDLPFTKEDVQNFMEESTIPEFISDKVAGLVSDALLGEATTTITVDEIVGLVNDNKTLIEDTFQVEIPEETLEEIQTSLEETFGGEDLAEIIRDAVNEGMGLESPDAPNAGEGDADIGTDPDTGTTGTDTNNGTTSAPSHKGPLATIPDVHFQAGLDLITSVANGETTEMGMAQAVTMLRFIVSTPVLVGLIGLCLALIALLFLFNWGKPGSAMIWAGVPLMLNGGTLTAGINAINMIGLPINLSGITQTLTMIHAGVLVLGLALIIFGAIINSTMKKNRKKAIAAYEAYVAAQRVAAEQAAAAANAPVCEPIEITPAEETVAPVFEITEDAAEEVAEVTEEVAEVTEEVAEVTEEAAEETAEV